MRIIGSYSASLLYLEDLYRFILVDVLEDVELFDMCTGPFLKVDFSGDLWLYLDDLDSYLQTDNGAKAFATLSEYFGTNSDKSIVSYCCVRAKILKTTCIHSEKGTKLPKIKREISNTMPTARRDGSYVLSASYDSERLSGQL